MSSVKHIRFACRAYYFCCELIFSFASLNESRRNKCCYEQILDSYQFTDSGLMTKCPCLVYSLNN